MQSVDNKYTVVTETCDKTVQISSLTYRNYINREIGKLYNILTLKNLVEKTDSKATSIRRRIETTQVQTEALYPVLIQKQHP